MQAFKLCVYMGFFERARYTLRAMFLWGVSWTWESLSASGRICSGCGEALRTGCTPTY